MINKVLCEHLQGCQELAPFLATYAGKMAVFYREAPDDQDSLWESGMQYGRIIIELNMAADPERSVSGTLNVHVSCAKGKQYPDELEAVLRPLIHGYFFTAEGMTMSASWKQTDFFDKASDKVSGATISFSLLAYPVQTTPPPDPAGLLNKWSGEVLSEKLGQRVYVIGYEPLPKVFKPDREHPAIYWRTTAVNKCGWIPDTWNCSWMAMTLQGHVVVPGYPDTANFIARAIDCYLTRQSPLKFEDNGPLYVDRNNRVNITADPQRVGQITVEATYGILDSSEATKMEHIYISQK